MKSVADVKAFVGNRGMLMNGNMHSCGGRLMICLSVLPVVLTKILNLSNNAGWPMNTSFIGRSWRQNSSVSICRPTTS